MPELEQAFFLAYYEYWRAWERLGSACMSISRAYADGISVACGASSAGGDAPNVISFVRRRTSCL